MAAVTMVKGETAADDRTWMSLDDGSTRRVAIHAVHDLPHLVVESRFGLEHGLWGVLARGGFSNANRALTRRDGRRPRLVTDAPSDNLAREHWLDHRVAKAATNAVVNRGQAGPDTPSGVRERLLSEPAVATVDDQELAARLRDLAMQTDDEAIDQAISGTRQLARRWAALNAGETLHLEWPLPVTATFA